MEQFRIGTIGGNGWIGQVHATSMQNVQRIYLEDNGIPEFQIVSDLDAEKLKDTQRRFGYKEITTDWKDVVTHPDVDVVDIATPNNMHYEMAKAALENDKHVFCEKPLTLSAVQSQELADLARIKGKVNYVAFNNLLNPANQYAKDLVQSGKLGDIVRIKGTYDQDMLSDPNIPIAWRHINRLSGSGALGDLGSHLISVFLMILGDVEEVTAMSKKVIPQRPKTQGSQGMQDVENEDIIESFMKFKNGAIGTIGSSRVATGRKNYFTYEIQGTEGSLYYDLESLNEMHVYFKADEGPDMGFRRVLLNEHHGDFSYFQPAPGIAIGFNDMKITEAHTVINAVVRNGDYTSDFNFGAKTDKVTDAIIKSAESKTWERL